MKYALVILFTITISISNGQWIEQNTLNNNSPKKFNFITDDLGYSLGTAGSDEHILKTINGGSSWSDINLPGVVEIFDFHFYQDAHGVIFCQGTSDPIQIYQTIDDGINWTNITPDSISNAIWVTAGNNSAIHFVNDNVGFIGKGGLLSKTIDGGATWNEYILDVSSQGWQDYFGIGDVHFYDENNGVMGLMGGIFFYGGAMFVTSNAGNTWKEKYLGDPGSGIGKVIQVSETTSYAAPVKWGGMFSLELYKTTNSGATWETIYVPDTIVGSGISDYDFYDENYGVVVLEVGSEYILYSTIDGGETWIHCGNLENLGAGIIENQDIEITANSGFVTGEFESFFKLSQGYSSLVIEDNVDKKLVVYPNPVESGGLIYFKNENNLKDIDIVNLIGEVVYVANDIDSSLQLPNLLPGIYFIQTTSDISKKTTRIIIL